MRGRPPPRAAAAPARRLAPLGRPRTLRPTRAGWLFFALTFGVGFAALNTGNNLLYLVLSLLLALPGAVGRALRGGAARDRRASGDCRFEVRGRPRCAVVLEIANAQPRSWAHAIVVEDLAGGDVLAGTRARPRLRPAPRARGCARRAPTRFGRSARASSHFAGFRVSTRFPFGLFAKSLLIEGEAEIVVYPRNRPATRRRAIGSAQQRRRGDGAGRSAGEPRPPGCATWTPGDSAAPRPLARVRGAAACCWCATASAKRSPRLWCSSADPGPARRRRLRAGRRRAASEVVAQSRRRLPRRARERRRALPRRARAPSTAPACSPTCRASAPSGQDAAAA